MTPRAVAVTPPAQRLWQIDALRGLMLVLMTVTHLPTRWSSPLGQPFGFVSAAEGFVLLSGFMAGLVYTRKQHREGEPPMRRAFLRRALKIYLCQGALLLFLFSAILLLGFAFEQAAVTNLMSFFIDRPWAALFGALLLVYNPPLLDILPMYVVFMLASPVLLVHGQRGWGGILAISVALWLGAQFGLGEWLYEAIAAGLGVPVPLQQTGAFSKLAWQLLWVIGLWLGAAAAAPGGAAPLHFPPWMVHTALGIALVCFVWRHAVGQVPVPGPSAINLMFDKWHLGPLRLINLFALIVLALHFAPRLSARLPRLRMLEMLGAASLPVFCAHLVLVLLALALVGPAEPPRPWSLDLSILAGSLALLCCVALLSRAVDRQAAAAAARLKAFAPRRQPPALQRLSGGRR